MLHIILLHYVTGKPDFEVQMDFVILRYLTGKPDIELQMTFVAPYKFVQGMRPAGDVFHAA